MFIAIGNFFAMFAELFSAGREASGSLNDFASLGRIKSQTMLKEEQLRSSSNLELLTAELKALNPPKS